jgi:hypothetical protein
MEQRTFDQLDSDPTVLCYVIEPIRIPYDGGVYVPDLLIEYADGRKVLAEIKNITEVLSDENRRKFTAAELFAASSGYSFEVWVGSTRSFLARSVYIGGAEGKYPSWREAVQAVRANVRPSDRSKHWSCEEIRGIFLIGILLYYGFRLAVDWGGMEAKHILVLGTLFFAGYLLLKVLRRAFR